jgi:hypothetical protein
MRHIKSGLTIFFIIFLGLAVIGEGSAFSEATLDLTKQKTRARIFAGGFITTKPIFPLGLIVATQDPVLYVTEGDSIFIRLEPREEAKTGDRFSIARLDKMIDHPITKARVGQLVRIVGEVVVTGRKNDQLSAQVTKSFIAVKPGDIVIPPFEILPKNLPVRLTGKAQGALIATADEAENLTTGEVIFIDRGSKDGVIVGDLFSIYQTAYDYMKTETQERSPNVQSKVGEAIAVVTMEETTSAVISKSLQAIHVGDKVVSGRQ